MIVPDWMIKELCLGFMPIPIEDYYSTLNQSLLCKIDNPMVTPFDPELVNPASLDIRVGNTAKLRVQEKYLAKIGRKFRNLLIDIKNCRSAFIPCNTKFSKYKSIDLSEYSEQNPYLLRAGDRVLIDSLETFNLPNFICAQFRLKSSRGREWYEHMEAGFCDPGWHGSKLTMEVINMDLEPLPLYTGLRMGQLIFSLMLAIPEKDYSKTGRYNNDPTAMESKG